MQIVIETLLLLELSFIAGFFVFNIITARNYYRLRRYIQLHGSTVLGKSVTTSPIFDPFYAPIRIAIYTLAREYKKEEDPELRALAKRHNRNTYLFFFYCFLSSGQEH